MTRRIRESMAKKEIPVWKEFSAPPSPALGKSKTMVDWSGLGEQSEDEILRGTHMEDAN